ncbi:hypothetical protein ACFX5K_05445 [Rickettsiales bacterium LUAb2]
MKQQIYNHLWQYIRIMKSFSLFDLQVLLTLDNVTFSIPQIERYLHSLSIVKIIKPLKNNTYNLMQNLGAMAPILVSDDVVYDPNNKINLMALRSKIIKIPEKTIAINKYLNKEESVF